MTAALEESRLAGNKAALETFLAKATGAKAVEILDASPLSGGAIQENWLLDLAIHGGAFAGRLEAVLRTDAPSGVAVSRSRAEEFALLSVARQAGITVPEPLWLCADKGVLGKAFYVMRRVAGTAAPHRLMKDAELGGDRDKLAARLGEELARIHSVTPPRTELGFLGEPPADAAKAAIALYRRYLDELGGGFLALEWGLRWCELHAPPPVPPVLVHQDFRTGNYMVDRQGLTAILDWEFADWGDPMSDLGWFCAACWRYAHPELEAGGIAPRAPFYHGYESGSGRRVDPAAVAFWEVMAHIRWAVIALQQGERTLSGGEDSLELALTGRVYPPEVEAEILRQTAPQRWEKTA
ncbi:phosphotransferase family protein [Pelagibius sp. 7325]|uniref:phosphotransferase family protein n=1 Tax=Pelagibius sp. 7325 TaxID=3131994 RepID=UPI0030EDEAF5